MKDFLTMTKFTTLFIAFALIVTIQGCATGRSRQTGYASPQDATDQMVAALRSHDRATLQHILGPDADAVILSGDKVEDRNTADTFVTRYDEKHSLQTDDENTVTLLVGDNEWPLPIPIIKAGDGTWRFDTEIGMDEIINRRIGRNELSTIQSCLAVVDAQHDYAMMEIRGDGVPEYAQKFISDPGRKNGLYWDTKEGEPPSPLGALAAEASAEGYSTTKVAGAPPRAYHGYHYRMLTKQGEGAHGISYNYMTGDRMLGGFGVLAYPAHYGSSGIMSFITNQEGVVYQCDLGEDTEKIALEMDTYDPGKEWQKVPDKDTKLP